MKDGDTAHPLILNVDDNESSRYIISQLLQHAGFVVVEAVTGSAALRLIAHTPPELILLDVHLPDMEGFALCRHLKADPITASIPVLQRSALFTRSQDQVRGLEGGADGYLTEPVDPEVLLATIKALLRARRAEEAVREAATHYQLLFEKNPTPLWVFEAETLRVLAANEAALRFLGYPHDEFLGLTLRELRPPEDIPVLLETYARVAPHHSTPAFLLVKEMRLRGKDGTLLNAELRWGPLMFQGEKAWLAMAIDIAARKQAEEARVHFAAIVESSEDAILSKTLEGIILSWNTGAERLYGYKATEVIGQSVTLLVPPEQPDEVPRILARLRRGERIESYETVRQKKDGTRVHISLTVSPVKNEAEQIIGASVIARDITARKRAEEELRKFASLVENSIDFVGMALPEGPVLFVNPAGQKIVGVAGDEHVRTTQMLDYVAEQDRERFQHHVLPAVFRDGRWEGETLFRHFKTDAPIPMWQQIFFITEPGSNRHLALATTSRDITASKRQKRGSDSRQSYSAPTPSCSSSLMSPPMTSTSRYAWWRPMYSCWPDTLKGNWMRKPKSSWALRWKGLSGR